MICEYFDPGIELLLCRSRRTSDWIAKGPLKDPFWRLYWHPGKAARLRCGASSLEFGPESVALIPPETEFKPDMDCAFEQFYVHFRAARPFDRLRCGILRQPADEAALSLIASIQELLKSEEARPSRQLSLLGLSLCSLALGRIAPELYAASAGSSKAAAACESIEAGFREGVSNGELAKAAGMNVNAFIKLFKSETGSSPQKHLKERRVREACVLLRFSEKSIDEIAMETGFVDRSHLSRVFKALRGKSPAEYRRAGA